MGQDSDRLLTKLNRLVLAFSVLPQLLYMHFVLGMPFREPNATDLYLGVIVTSSIGAALYSLSYFLVYRPAKLGNDKNVTLAAVLIGIFSTITMSFVPLGFSLFFIAFLYYQKNRKDYKKSHIKPPDETVLTTVLDLGDSAAFVKLRRRKLISKSLRLAFLAGYFLILIEGLGQIGLVPSRFIPLPAQLNSLVFVDLIIPMLSIVYLGLNEVISYEPMKRIYKFLPGRTGHITSLRRGNGDYRISVEGVKFNAHSSPGLPVGAIVAVKKVVMSRNQKVAMLYIEP